MPMLVSDGPMARKIMMALSPLPTMTPPIMTLSPVPTKPRVLKFARTESVPGSRSNFNDAVAGGVVLAASWAVCARRERGDDGARDRLTARGRCHDLVASGDVFQSSLNWSWVRLLSNKVRVGLASRFDPERDERWTGPANQTFGNRAVDDNQRWKCASVSTKTRGRYRGLRRGAVVIESLAIARAEKWVRSSDVYRPRK